MKRLGLILCLFVTGCLQPAGGGAPSTGITAASLGEAVAKRIESGDIVTTQQAWKVFSDTAKKSGLNATLGPIPKNEKMTDALKKEWAAKARAAK